MKGSFSERNMIFKKIGTLLELCCAFSTHLIMVFWEILVLGSSEQTFSEQIGKTATQLMQKAAWGSVDIAKPFPFALESHLCDHMTHQLYSFGPFPPLSFTAVFCLPFPYRKKLKTNKKSPRNKVLTRAARTFNYNWNQEQSPDHVQM